MGKLNIRGHNVRVEWKVPFDTARRGLRGSRSRQTLFNGSPRRSLHLPSTAFQSSPSAFNPSFNVPTSPFGYYTAPSHSVYPNHSNFVEYSSPQGMFSSHYGPKNDSSQVASPYLTHDIQPGFMGPLPQHSTIQDGARMPGSTDQDQRNPVGGDRVGWQVAYDRYNLEPPRMLTNPYSSPVLMGLTSTTCNTSMPAYSTNQSLEPAADVFDQAHQGTAPQVEDTSASH